METAEAQQSQVDQGAENGEAQQDQSQPGADGQNGSQETLEAKFARLEERYKHSSEEGKRLHEELKKERESKSSLKNGEQQPIGLKPFIDKASYVKHWTENGEKTEKEASAEYEREANQHNLFNFLYTQNQALNKRLDFESKQREQGFSATVPGAKEAQEFFKDVPEIMALPVADQVDRYQKLMQRKGVPATSRDTSQLKTGLSPTGGSGGGKQTASPEFDTMAKGSGFVNYAAMQELNKCETQQDFADWKAKYEKRK